jgi:CheY-like chemotaxis protein
LRSEGASVTSAATIVDLLAACKSQTTKFDVVITDWNLQLCNGEAAYQQIVNELAIQPRWIVISGDIKDSKERELILKNVPVIRKPFSPELLLRELEKIRCKREAVVEA